MWGAAVSVKVLASLLGDECLATLPSIAIRGLSAVILTVIDEHPDAKARLQAVIKKAGKDLQSVQRV